MTRYVLDTTTLSHLQRSHPRVVLRYNDALTRKDQVGTTTVNVEEVVGGWFGPLRRCRAPTQEAMTSESLAEAVRVLGRLVIHPVSMPALARFDSLVKSKLNVGRMDLKIAAVALELGATVVSDNLRDFGRVPGLAVEDWLA
jgi:tRNA(fMet)-specific endonuclease VapC